MSNQRPGGTKDTINITLYTILFLKAGNVFTDSLIDSYISLKMDEVLQFEHTPHPVEFKMYYSV